MKYIDIHLYYNKFILDFIYDFTKIPLMEMFILIDGLICAFTFFKEYTILKLSESTIRIIRTTNIKTPINLKNTKKELVKKYNNIYILTTMDRYLVYLIIYFINFILELFLELFLDIDTIVLGVFKEYRFNPRIFYYIICFPFFQNLICNYNRKIIKKYNEDKEIFIKYNLSKLIIAFVEKLHPNILKIPNYHIFILYKNISFTYLYNTIKVYLFITLLYFLKGNSNLYYYYKAIKLAYFYETGFLFNIIPTEMAVYTANLVIKNKRYNELSKIEICNAFYILIKDKFKMNEKSFYINTVIVVLKIFSFWSLVSFSKIMYILLIKNIQVYNLFYVFSAIIYSRHTTHTRRNTRVLLNAFIKKLVILTVIYFLISFNINDIIITLTLLLHNVIYYILEEIYFFKSNNKNIRVVLAEYYKEKPLKIEEYVKID